MATPSRSHLSTRWLIFSGGFGRRRSLVCLLSRAIGLCSRRCFDFTCLTFPHTRFSGIWCAPFGCLLRPTLCVRLPGTSLVLLFLNTASFEPLRTASLRALSQKVLFLLALATGYCQEGWGAPGFIASGFLRRFRCLSLLRPGVRGQV